MIDYSLFMRKVILFLMALMLFSCSKDIELYEGGVQEQEVVDGYQQQKTNINGLYYLDIAYNGTDTIKAYVSDESMMLYQGLIVNEPCYVSYTADGDKIVFGDELVNALETMYIGYINKCRDWVKYWGEIDYNADNLSFYNIRMNKIADERKAFMTHNGLHTTIWDVSLSGDFHYDGNITITIHHNSNGLSKTYRLIPCLKP